MLILNFSHPFTAAQHEQLVALLGKEPEIRTVPVMIDNELSLEEQVALLADRVGLTAEDWQLLPLIVNPPAFAPAAMALLAELHGRIGHFPTLLRLRPVPRTTPLSYEIAELLNLQSIREDARIRR